MSGNRKFRRRRKNEESLGRNDSKKEHLPAGEGRSLSSEAALEVAVSACASRREIKEWEVYIEEKDRLMIEVKEGEVESLVSARACGLAVRVLARGAMGFSYTNRFVREAVEEAVDQALSAALLLPRDPWAGLPEDPTPPPSLPIFDRRLSAIPLRHKIAAAHELEASALAYDPRVKRVRHAAYEETLMDIRLMNSHGIRRRGRGSLIVAGLEAVAEERGEARSFSELETVHFYDKLDLPRLGKSAAENAVRLLKSRGLRSGRRPVVFSAAAAANFIALLGPAVCGDAVDKGRSFLAEKRGRRVAGTSVSLVDDALNAEGPEASPFDDEGVVSRQTRVVEEGRLENFLYNTYYGKKRGEASTGNGIRARFYLPPGVRTTNWILLPGGRTAEALIGEVEEGFYVVELSGLHTADPVSGEFSLGATGFMIRRGKTAEGVCGVIVAGTMDEVLARVAAVADKIKFAEEAGAPAVLVEEMDVCGPKRRKEE